MGALVTPLLVTPIYLYWGWRGAFWFTGFIGLAWLTLWSVVGRRPDIRMRPSPEGKTRSARPRFADTGLWAFMCAYALGALPLGFVLYSAALYLAHPLGYSQEVIGKVLWIPPLGWECGYFVWGWLSDRSLRSGAPRVRSLGKMMGYCAVLSLPFAAIPWLSNIIAVMAAMFLAMFVASGFVVLSVAYATHVYSADHAGLIAGSGAGSWSLLVAVMMPWFGRLFDHDRHAQAFWIATVIPLLGYTGWLIFNRQRVRAASSPPAMYL